MLTHVCSVCIPALLIAGVNAYNLWTEHWEHWSHMPPLEERVEYPYQNVRTKNYPWGDGDKVRGLQARPCGWQTRDANTCDYRLCCTYLRDMHTFRPLASTAMCWQDIVALRSSLSRTSWQHCMALSHRG